MNGGSTPNIRMLQPVMITGRGYPIEGGYLLQIGIAVAVSRPADGEPKPERQGDLQYV
jgi:hypothetical protein